MHGSETLRDASKRWMQEQGFLHKALVTSSKDKKTSYLADCDRCEKCIYQFCFSIEGKEVCIEKIDQ